MTKLPWRAYPYLTIEFRRMAGGGGGMTGEMDPKCSLYFAVGPKSGGPYGGKVGFQVFRKNSLHETQVYLRDFSFAMEDELLAQRAVELASLIAAKVERCKLLLQALKALYPDVPILHNSKHFIELRDEYDAMLENEGVNIKFKQPEKLLYPSPGVTFLDIPQEAKEQALLYHPGSEICGLYAYDFRLDQTQKCIAIQSKNVIKECDEVLNDVIQMRNELLKYSEMLPAYFHWIGEKEYGQVLIPYKKLLRHSK